MSTAASAQVREGTVEINPYVGYLFGGEFSRGKTNLFEFPKKKSTQKNPGP